MLIKERIRKRVSGSHKGTLAIIMGTLAKRHSFSKTTIETPLPDNWKSLTIEKYDGSTDPDEHVAIYTTQISMYTWNDDILCRVFPTTLKGATLSWFTRLPPLSIDCFDTLIEKFGAQFATSRPHHLTLIALVNIRQEKMSRCDLLWSALEEWL